jgi:adenylyltransferase/sulfurtransferase
MEAIKLLLGIGEAPLGKLMCYDALRSSFRNLRIAPDPSCHLCGADPSLHSIHNPETTSNASCTMSTSDIPTITVEQLAERLENAPVLIDVRQPEEHAEASIPGSILIPLGELADRFKEIPEADEILVHCKSGGRSAKAVTFLQEQGITGATNIAGGMDAWLKRSLLEGEMSRKHRLS